MNLDDILKDYRESYPACIIQTAKLCGYDPLQAISEYTWLEIQYSKEVLPVITNEAMDKAYYEVLDTMLKFYAVNNDGKML